MISEEWKSLPALPSRAEYDAFVRSLNILSVRFAKASIHAPRIFLADPVKDAMHHQPPPGVHPEQFLVAVAAAYQRRHQPAGEPPPGALR